MANEPKKDTDSKKTGNLFGFSIGCFIIIITVAAVIFFLFLKPILEETGYSYDGLKENILDLKDKADDTLKLTDEVYQNGKDKADKHLDDLKDLDIKSREELDKASPKLIAD